MFSLVLPRMNATDGDDSYDVMLDVTAPPVHRIKSNLGRPADLAASVDNFLTG